MLLAVGEPNCEYVMSELFQKSMSSACPFFLYKQSLLLVDIITLSVNFVSAIRISNDHLRQN